MRAARSRAGRLFRFHAGGGNPTVLASAQAWSYDVVVANGSVYWLTLGPCEKECASGALWRVPVGGGPITQLASGLSGASGFLVLPTGFDALGARSGEADGGKVETVSFCPPSGCGESNEQLEVLVSQPNIRAIASDATSLFWLVSGTGVASLGSRGWIHHPDAPRLEGNARHRPWAASGVSTGSERIERLLGHQLGPGIRRSLRTHHGGPQGGLTTTCYAQGERFAICARSRRPPHR